MSAGFGSLFHPLVGGVIFTVLRSRVYRRDVSKSAEVTGPLAPTVKFTKNILKFVAVTGSFASTLWY